MRQTSLSRMAKRERWRDMLRSDGLPLCAKRSAVMGGKGGGFVYRIEVLLEAQQKQLRLKFATKQADAQLAVTRIAPSNVQERVDAFASLSSAKKAKAREMLVAINLFEQYRCSMSVRDALEKTGKEV